MEHLITKWAQDRGLIIVSVERYGDQQFGIVVTTSRLSSALEDVERDHNIAACDRLGPRTHKFLQAEAASAVFKGLGVGNPEVGWAIATTLLWCALRDPLLGNSIIDKLDRLQRRHRSAELHASLSDEHGWTFSVTEASGPFRSRRRHRQR